MNGGSDYKNGQHYFVATLLTLLILSNTDTKNNKIIKIILTYCTFRKTNLKKVWQVGRISRIVTIENGF